MKYRNPARPASLSFDSQFEITERLMAEGKPASAIADALVVMRSGHGDILTKLIAGELTVEQARAITRQRRRR